MQQPAGWGVHQFEITHIHANGSIITCRKGGTKYPSTTLYEIDDVLKDLLEFAARHMVEFGRLVYWLPLANDTLDELSALSLETAIHKAIPQHPQLQLVSFSRQTFGKWQRLLVCQQLVLQDVGTNLETDTRTISVSHNDFRRLYFTKSATPQ